MKSQDALRQSIKAPALVYECVCLDANGVEKWRERVPNLVTTAGRNNIIDTYFRGSAYTAAWFLGLKGTGTPSAADTMASHASWSEITGYVSATLPGVTFGAPSGGTSTASVVVYAINATATVAGCFVTTNNTKGATTGVLYSVADFSAARTVANGDTLNVTVSQSAT
jgi:hypothetical protein